MRKWIGLIQIASFCLWLPGCGPNTTSTNPIPTPIPSDSGGPVPLPDPTKKTDSRIPDLSRAVSIRLTDTSNYSALSDISHNIFPPLVGDALLKLTLFNSRERAINGSIFFAFEDQYGFWGATLSSFPGTGVNDGSRLEMIFADDEVVLHVSASRNVDTLEGQLFYRMRETGDTACKIPQSAEACKSYMNSSNSKVKSVGSFRAKFSDWATSEGQ